MRILALMAMLVLASMACVAMADWPQFLGPDRNGIAPDFKLPKAFPEGGPKVLWTFPLRQGFAGPSIKDGKVYVLDRVDDAQDVLRCIDLAGGKELWSFAYDAPGKLDHNGSRTTPAVDDKYVFVIGPFGHFHCVDQATHKLVWKKHLLDDFGGKRPEWGVAQSPLLHKDAVIVAPLGKQAGVVAFEKATGTIIWQSRPFDTMAYSSPLVTTIEGVEQVIMMGARRVAGIDVKDGKLLWTYTGYRCNIHIPSPAPVGDGRIFLTGGYNAGSAMFKVSRESEEFKAELLFKAPELGSQIHGPLLHQGHLYLACNTNSKRDGLVCMDLDGNVKWQTRRSPNFERGNLILVGGIILIMDGSTGILRMVRPDPSGYQEIDEAKILAGRDIWAPMAVADGKLVLRDQRQMKCLDFGAKGTSPGG